MGGGSSAPQPAPVQTSGGTPNYVPTGSANADQNLQNLQNQQFGAATSYPGYALPQYQQISNDLVNNPYAAGAQNAANNQGMASSNLAGQSWQGSTALQAMGNQAAPYGQQILQTGFDPQSALYNRTQQQTMDQLQAANAMSGLSGSPYGAGVVGQGISNFNIDWQNQQLQRQATAASGYGALNSAVGNDYSGANALGASTIGQLGQAGSIPYSTSTGISQTQLGGLGALGAGIQGSYAPAQTLANDYQSYLGLGNNATSQLNSAQNSNYGQQLAAFNAQNAQNNSSLAGLGSLAGGIFDQFGSGGAFASGGALAKLNPF